jgi:hypothetical protein
MRLPIDASFAQAGIRRQVIGEALGEVFFLVYARPRPGTCRLITAWAAEPHERDLWHDITR